MSRFSDGSTRDENKIGEDENEGKKNKGKKSEENFKRFHIRKSSSLRAERSNPGYAKLARSWVAAVASSLATTATLNSPKNQRPIGSTKTKRIR